MNNASLLFYHKDPGDHRLLLSLGPLDMDSSADGLPLLSQDEFFRHLNLQSVHASSAKYHYRQALKERLRASKVASLNGLNGLSSSNRERKKYIAPNGYSASSSVTTILINETDPIQYINGAVESDKILIRYVP